MRPFKSFGALLTILMAVAFNCVIGAALGSVVDQPLLGAIVTNALGVGQNAVRMYQHSRGVNYIAPMLLLSGLNQEVWIDDLLEQLRADISFIADGIDMSAWVQNNQINLAAEGTDPVVVIDDPSVLTPASRTDTALSVALNTFRSTPTIVTDMESAELAYDKMASINRQHVKAINQKFAQFTAFNWAPVANTSNTPVIASTGTDDGSGLKLLTSSDIAAMSRVADGLNWPDEGRTLVMDSATMWGLIDSDDKLKMQYGYLANLGQVPGVITNYYGWNIKKYNYVPTYRLVSSVWTRNAFGSTPTAGTDFKGAIAYVAKQNIVTAYGAVKMFTRIDDPSAQADYVSYRVRATGKVKKQYLIGAIVRPSA